MSFRHALRALTVALGLGLAACGSGSNVASPGATNPGSPPGGGGGGGGGGTSTLRYPAGHPLAGQFIPNSALQTLTGTIVSNTTLFSGNVYRISGRVDVGSDGGGSATGATGPTLTVQPGVILWGDDPGDILIVNRGSRIAANGTASQPIIFTSNEDLLNTNDPATANRQWGGLIVLGRAPIRNCNLAVTQGGPDCQNAIEGVTAATGRAALYGGNSPTDNSGSLSFVQVRYPGAFLTSAAAGDDLNGISLGGVGSGTFIDNVQVHNSGDDGIEVFGGTVNMKHVVITGALDDSLDFDEGWTGKVQFLVIKQTSLTGGPDRMIEASNRLQFGATGTPINTFPIISNFTFVGVPQNGATNLIGIDLNNTAGTPGSSARLMNGVVTGSTTCLRTDTANTSPAPVFNSILFSCAGAYSAATQTSLSTATNTTTNVPSTLGGVFPGPNELAVVPTNAPGVDAFFTTANYAGAFSSTESIGNSWATGWTFQLFAAPACPSGTSESGSIAGQRRCTLAGTVGAGTLPANMRLVFGNIYEISGRVDVGVDRGGAGTGGTAASLTIDPGVTLYGDAAADILIVNRGSQIFVNGTRAAPVIMTSLPDINGSQPDPVNASREWAGMIVLGRGPIRNCNLAVAQGSVDCQNAIEGVTAATGSAALYGGATADDNSGRIQFLQIRYPGAFLTSAAAGDDLNGLSLGGVGSGTTISNVQIHNSGDDGIEVFGGAVNMKNVIITGAVDDSLDYDEGWVGKVQFAIIVQSNTGQARDRLVEASNRLQFGAIGTPINTNPTIANFTFVGVPTNGASNLIGIDLNNTAGTPGSSGRYINGVVTGSTTCLRTDTANPSPAPVFNSILFDCVGAYSAATQTTLSTATNTTTNVANTLSGTFVNGATENARAALDPATVDPFFTSTNYIGAVRNTSDNWWQTWSCGLPGGQTC